MKRSELAARRGFALLGRGFGAGATDFTLVTNLRAGADAPVLWLAPFELPGRECLAFAGDARPVALELDVAPATPEVTLHADGHARDVERIRAAIAAGDVYQVCLTVRASLSLVSPAALFARLSAGGQARFAAWLRLPGGLEVVSGSPELFFAIDGTRVRSEPMKGTAAPDAAADLEASPKDAAELAMITDLVRNDLTSVCRPRSVRVVAARRTLALPYALQTVSEIEGELPPRPLRASVVAVLEALHPGGSVTGAPKRAALAMIRALEPSLRGPYCGALAFASEGRVRASLLIRTAWREGTGPFTYGVGGGIVFDSDPERERAELDVKLGALR
ncbi:MAG: chorismate-binding protein [Myxococcales bacterium]|nr:chorismate-binding protein [Myxococcales bacterium]